MSLVQAPQFLAPSFPRVVVVRTHYVLGTSWDSGDTTLWPIGTPAADRLVVVVIAGRVSGSSGGIASCTIAGGAGTLVAGTGTTGNATATVSLWQRVVASGTTMSLGTTGSGMTGAHITLLALYGANPSVYDTGTSDIDVRPGGAAIAVQASIRDDGSAVSHTWGAPFTEDDDHGPFNNGSAAVAHFVSSGNKVGQAVSVTPSVAPDRIALRIGSWRAAS